MPNLVGIGNTQVPTNAMLGRLAYQDSVGNIDIEKIKARIEDTATDVFVYDTSKDSDGGAWRHRTQDTSWYNEGASATRGARKEFPAVAVIVCFTSGLAIYDGDDPNLPLWMEWTTTNGTYMLRGPTNGRIAAMNGIIALSNASTYGGVVAIYLISDTSRSYRQLVSNNKSEGYFIGNGIAARNDFSTNCYSNAVGGNILPALVDENTTDVAITVLPNAPIDPDTGLPIPTIAVATIGGTSIIKDDGTAVSIVYTGSPSTAYVDFRKSDNAIVMSMNSNGSYVHVIHDIPASSVTGSQNYQKEGIDNEFYRTGSSQDWNQDVWIYAASPFGGDTVRIVNNVISGNGGINFLSPSRTAPATDTMVARITSSFNSGYMHGDIKGAFLSSTDTTNLSGYYFQDTMQSDNTSNWTDAYADTFEYISSPLVAYRLVRSSGDARVKRNLSGTIPVGTKIVVTYEAYSSSGNKTIKFGMTTSSYDQSQLSTVSVDTNWNQIQFQATFGVTGGSSHTYVTLWNSSTGEVRYRNFRVRVAEEDRGKDNTSLAYYGTITKEPVATGAELVAYSGYTYNNYLDCINRTAPGTGDFSVIAWIKPGTNGSGTGNYFHLFNMGRFDVTGQNSGTGFVLKMATNGSNGYSPYIYNNDGGTSHGTYNTNNRIRLGVWSQLIGMRRGGRAYLYLNGRLLITGNTWSTNLTDTYISIGRAPGFSNEIGGDAKVALVRYSTTAPSDNQIKKMYEDERCLFHENAKCTLHGTSDAVTALAFDDTNDILHVGTSAGRSEFQGLNRINNTTTAVTKAISASNGLIAEQ